MEIFATLWDLIAFLVRGLTGLITLYATVGGILNFPVIRRQTKNNPNGRLAKLWRIWFGLWIENTSISSKTTTDNNTSTAVVGQATSQSRLVELEPALRLSINTSIFHFRGDTGSVLAIVIPFILFGFGVVTAVESTTGLWRWGLVPAALPVLHLVFVWTHAINGALFQKIRINLYGDSVHILSSAYHRNERLQLNEAPHFTLEEDRFLFVRFHDLFIENSEFGRRLILSHPLIFTPWLSKITPEEVARINATVSDAYTHWASHVPAVPDK